MNKKMTQTVMIAVLLAIMIGATGAGIRFATQDIGYSTGFQGPKARFVGINYSGKKYTASNTEAASSLALDTTLSFDPDTWDDDKPNVEGEMTSVFIPEESLSSFTSWIPADWLKRNDLIKNPQRTFAWNISTKTYKMEQWVLKFYVSFSGHWDGQEAGLDALNLGQNIRNYLQNCEVWIEFDLEPTWYIQGGGTAYFAIAKIQLAQSVLKQAEDNLGNKQDPDTQLSVVPESTGSLLYIYNGLFGAGAAEKTEATYQGKQLNPKLFTDKVYAKINLANFGIRSWNKWTTVKTRGDVATFDFDITVFVIGEWDVQDIQQIPTDFGRTSKTEQNPSLLDYLSDPRVQALLTLLAGLGLLILIIIVAPGFLIALVAIFMGGRKRS